MEKNKTTYYLDTLECVVSVTKKEFKRVKSSLLNQPGLIRLTIYPHAMMSGIEITLSARIEGTPSFVRPEIDGENLVLTSMGFVKLTDSELIYFNSVISEKDSD